MEPLAHKFRIDKIDNFIFYENNLILKKLIENDNIISSIFFGPSGSGKTTICKIIKTYSKNKFIELSAVSSGKADLKKVCEGAINLFKLTKQKTILFIDEIHRFNKIQQDFLLPYVESGEIILICATTENPGFEINNALMSRLKLFKFEKLKKEDILSHIKNILKTLNLDTTLNEDILNYVVDSCNGDLRICLNNLDLIIRTDLKNLEQVKKYVKVESLNYDKNEHYNMASALQKSVRDCDYNAGLYWAFRMLESGEDPKFVFRRLIVIASEDIGIGNNNALIFANTCFNSFTILGMPEGEVILSQLIYYLCKSKHSNKTYMARAKVKDVIKRFGNLEVPKIMRKEITSFDKKQELGKGYIYYHNLSEEEKKNFKQKHLPDEIEDIDFFD